MKKTTYYIVIGLFVFCSCKKQNAVNQLSVEKLYIFEYNYNLHDYETDRDTAYFEFRVAGFSELDQKYNLKYARQLSWDSPYYYDLETVIPDSMRLKISAIISKYQKDTAFLYKGECRIYDGNAYQFLIQRDTIKVFIRFEPKFLPDDLRFLYDYLYGNRQKTEHKSSYKELFEMFKGEVHDELPPPTIRSTIKFTPPKIEKEKR